jgi:hypothetical protein
VEVVISMCSVHEVHQLNTQWGDSVSVVCPLARVFHFHNFSKDFDQSGKYSDKTTDWTIGVRFPAEVGIFLFVIAVSRSAGV